MIELADVEVRAVVEAVTNCFVGTMVSTDNLWWNVVIGNQ